MCNSKSPYVRAKRRESIQETIGTIIGTIIGYVCAPMSWFAYYVLLPATVILSLLYPFIVAYLCVTQD